MRAGPRLHARAQLGAATTREFEAGRVVALSPWAWCGWLWSQGTRGTGQGAKEAGRTGLGLGRALGISTTTTQSRFARLPAAGLTRNHLKRAALSCVLFLVYIPYKYCFRLIVFAV